MLLAVLRNFGGGSEVCHGFFRTPGKSSSSAGEEESFSVSDSSIELIDGSLLCFFRSLCCRKHLWAICSVSSVWRSSSLFTKCPTSMSILSFTSLASRRFCGAPWPSLSATLLFLEALLSAQMHSACPRKCATLTAELPTLFCRSNWRPSLLKALTRNSTTGAWSATTAYINAVFPQVSTISGSALFRTSIFTASR